MLRPASTAARPTDAAGQVAGRRQRGGRADVARGSNLSRLGDFNQVVLLDAIRRSTRGISRVELVAETGLTAQTVSNIVRRLIAEELVVESGRVRTTSRGKPRTLLRVQPSARFAVGVHVDPATLTYVLIDIEGTVRQYARRRTQ